MDIKIIKTEDGQYAATIKYQWGAEIKCIAGTASDAIRLVADDVGRKELSTIFLPGRRGVNQK